METPSAASSARSLSERLRDVTQAICQDWQGLEPALRSLTEGASDAMGVDRVSVWVFDGERALIRCRDLFDRGSDSHSAGTELRRDAFPAYFEALRTERVLAVPDALGDPRTEAFTEGYLDVHGIGALLDTPLWIAGRMAGVVCHEHVGGPRAWTPEEVAFAQSMGDLVSLVLESERRQEAEALLASRERLFSALAAEVARPSSPNHFAGVAEFLGRQLNADLAFVGELVDGGSAVRTVGAWRDGAPAPNFTYVLAGSPCRNVVGQQTCAYPEKVYELFPDDAGLVAIQAQAYVGTPLFTVDGEALGLIVAVYRTPLSQSHLAISAQRIFASRVSAELQRARTEAQKDRLESELLRAQRMESVGRLAGGIAHDFNNLLAPITAYAEMGVDSLPEGHPLVADLEEILDAADRACRLTRQLLAFGRKQVLETRSLDLNEVVESFRGMLRPVLRDDIELRLNLPEGPLPVRADVGQLEQVLMNLVVNAQDAMPDGGVLDISTRGHVVPPEGSRDHPNLPPGSYVSLRVADTGTGLDDETAAHLFEPFYTTKRETEGTGLGLATVYGIVQQHGGTVTAGNGEDRGAVFEIFLPGDRDTPADAPVDGRERPRIQPGSERVLVVEDEVAVRQLVTSVLTRAGYDVVAADGPEEALELLEGPDWSPDLLLSDVVMPGMNGVELYNRVAGTHPGVRVLYMSGYAHEVIAGKGLDEVTLLPKPFSVRELTGRVRASLDR